MFFARTTATALLFSLLFLGGIALGANELRIHNASELIDFSDGVNNGVNYSGTTVYLDSDIVFDSSLSSRFQPIGNSVNCFHGTFDGQGHVISGLALNSNRGYAGLFGYSLGTAIKNVVLDESCSISSTVADTGSISGYYHLSTIEGVVNMASVTFNGSTSELNLGGIVGRFLSSSTIRNCVNYGPVTHYGVSNGISNIGGIVGNSAGSSIKSVLNCANYGTIMHNGKSIGLYMGDIVGNSYSGTIVVENCVSGGRILNLKQASGNNYIGTVVGNIKSGAETTIIHCIWTNNVGYNNVYSRNEGSVTVTSSSFKELNATTMNELNKYNEKNSTFSNWIMLHLNEGRINNISQKALIVAQKPFPEPVKEGYTFLFWCKDAKCAEIYDPETTDITGVTDLYAQYQVNYIITFVFNNGTENEVRVLNFNETIVYPEDVVKEGYTFNGWSPRPDRMPADNITITAQWIEISPEPEDPSSSSSEPEKPSEYVEIVFEKKDLKEEEIMEIIKKYAEREFAIEKIEIDEETGGSRVIVKFVDKETAQSFIDTVRASSEAKDIIKVVEFIYDSVHSLSVHLSLFNLFYFLYL